MVAAYSNEKNDREIFYLLNKMHKSNSSLKNLLKNLQCGVIICKNKEIIKWNHAMISHFSAVDPAFENAFNASIEKQSKKACVNEYVFFKLFLNFPNSFI